MRLRHRILACGIGAGLLSMSGAPAQQRRDADRPSIGLALSGGAALGLAHIGVLRYFEERHIPVDNIGGTSMGGLVGGLYAVGMDSSQIEAIARQADWNALLNPNPPFADQPIVDKQKWNRTFGSLTLRFGKRFALPTGLNPGESLSLFLSRSTLGYSDVSNFDQLPTPFRCVATDLVNGDSVVLSKGSLPRRYARHHVAAGVRSPFRDPIPSSAPASNRAAMRARPAWYRTALLLQAG
jgi:NTE family protein